ncbi:hypothetical protein ACFL6S_29075, partial [Candidatus Poribacteria bacterium]
PGKHQYVLSSAEEAVVYCSSATGAEEVNFEAEPLKITGLALSDGDYGAEIVKPDKGVIDRYKVAVADGNISIELPVFTDDIAVHFLIAK